MLGDSKMRITLVGGSAAITLVALVSSAAPSQAYIPQPWLLGRNKKRIGGPGLRLQFVPAVRGQCGHLRGQSGHRSTPDGSGIDHLHVSVAGASQVVARLSIKPRLISATKVFDTEDVKLPVCQSKFWFATPTR